MKSAVLKIRNKNINIPISDELHSAFSQYEGPLNRFPSAEFSDYLEGVVAREKVTASISIAGNDYDFEIDSSIANPFFEEIKAGLAIHSDQEVVFSDILRVMLPYDERTPTARQLEFMCKIARVLNIDIPASALKNIDGCSLFIEKNKFEFDRKIHFYNSCETEAVRVSRWMVAHNSYHVAHVSLEDIAKRLDIKKTDTIKKYIASFEDWEKSIVDRPSEEVNILMELIGSELEEKFSDICTPAECAP